MVVRSNWVVLAGAVDMAEGDSMKPTFAGEIQLSGWSETHNAGCKVTFWLQSPDDLEAFRTLTIRKGNTAGHRFMAALVEIGDDELPIEPTPSELKGGALAKLAGQWCADPVFQKWLFVYSELEAAQKIKRFCEVDSRRMLDHNPKAADLFQGLFRTPFMKHLRGIELERETA